MLLLTDKPSLGFTGSSYSRQLRKAERLSGRYNMQEENISIFDTTLREGQSCPGAGMSLKKNLEYAHLAARFGVNVLEVGFPSASTVDFDTVSVVTKELASSATTPTIAALSPLLQRDIDRTLEALAPAIAYRSARLHLYMPIDLHLLAIATEEPRQSSEQVLKKLDESISRAFKDGIEVQFSPQGYTQSEGNEPFLEELIRTAVGAGASVINCPDTLGVAHPFQEEKYFVHLMNHHAAVIRNEFPDRDIVWSTHCHNDFGLALVNTLAAVFQGPVRQVQGCMNGIGERAGNAPLEQLAVALKHFVEPSGRRRFRTTAKLCYIQQISNFVSEHMLLRQPHWPISGENAARYSAREQADAYLENVPAYHPFNPEETGNKVSLLFNHQSGGTHAQSIVHTAGFMCNDEERQPLSDYVKSQYQERRKGITDAEVIKAYFEYRKPIQIEHFEYSKTAGHANLKMSGVFFNENGNFEYSSNGQDSVLAVLKEAIDEHLPGYSILSHQSQSEGKDISAQSISRIIIVDSTGVEFIGIGSDRDIEIAALRALIDAVNYAYIECHFRL